MIYLESVKKLTKETNKLEQIIYTSKDNISSLESKKLNRRKGDRTPQRETKRLYSKLFHFKRR